MSWLLIPTSYTCGIPSHLVPCFTRPVPNCRGRCWLLYAHTSWSVQTVTARAEVRPQCVYMDHIFTNGRRAKYVLIIVTSLWLTSSAVVVLLFSNSAAEVSLWRTNTLSQIVWRSIMVQNVPLNKCEVEGWSPHFTRRKKGKTKKKKKNILHLIIDDDYYY